MISGNQSQFITRKRGGCFDCFYLKFLWIFARAHSHKYTPDVGACHHCETSTALLNKRKCGIVIWFVGVFSKCVKLRKASGRETCYLNIDTDTPINVYARFSVADLREGAPSTCPPYCPNFSQFHAVFWKILAKLYVGTLSYGESCICP